MAAPAIRYDGDFKQQTAHIAYTPDFNPAVECIIDDKLATIGERYLAWIKRNSWGRGSSYAVNEDGTPVWQRDAVEALGTTKQRISATHNYLVKRGYLRDELKILYPVVSPQLGPDPLKSPDSPDFLDYESFLADWKVTHSPDFSELETAREIRKVADSKVKTIERRMLQDYKKWLTARTTDEKSATPEDSEEPIKSVGTYLPTSSSRLVGKDTGPTDQLTPPDPPESIPQPPAGPEEDPNSVEKRILMLPSVRQLQKKFHSLPSPELLRKIVQNLQGAPLDRFERRIEQRFAKIKTFGFLQNLALDVGNSYQLDTTFEEPGEDAEAERQLKIEAWRAILSDPNESPEMKQQTRELLEAELKKA